MLLAAAFSVATISVEDFLEVRRVQEHGVQAVATVIDVQHRRRRADEPKVRFITRQGTVIETWVGVHRWDGDIEVGTRREVLYDPADPEGSVLDRQEAWLYETHLLSALAVLVLTLGAVVAWWPGLLWATLAWIAVWRAEARRQAP